MLKNKKKPKEANISPTADRSFPGKKELTFSGASRWSHPQKIPQRLTSVTQNFSDKWEKAGGKWKVSQTQGIEALGSWCH